MALLAERAPRSAVRERRRPARRAQPVDRLQGGGRDRRARRQHPRDARRRSRPTRCCGWRCRGRRAQVAVLGHTRWASVGIVSEPNAHPVNSDELEQPGGARPPFVVGVLNGDVDNHAELRAEHGLHVAGPITTDAKVIPALVARHAAIGRAVRGVPPHGRRRSRGRSPSARRRPTSRAGCSSPSTAAARASTSASPRTATSWPASRTASSRRRRATSGSTASTAGRCSPSTPRLAGTLEGMDARGLRRLGAARDRPTTWRPPR